MAKRRKIGVIYQYNENWIGGTYYIENLISALNLLPDKIKPQIIIFTENPDNYNNLFKKIKYPYLVHREYEKKLNIYERNINKVSRKIFNRNYFNLLYTDIDVVFPASNERYFLKTQRFLYWIPDFQEHFLPEFFTENELSLRKEYQNNILKNANYILFSSESVKKDFKTIYPLNELKQFVVPFAVTHPLLMNNNNMAIKYTLPSNYFICCNQFWKHKNHIVILKAINLLKEIGINIFVAFTGKEHDYRNPEYYNDIKKLVNDLSISENVMFLGFINREDQLELMKQSIAVIQPSLFEGWSTVIEDAKALGTNIIASKIEVHYEQLDEYNLFELFDPHNVKELSEKIKHYLKPCRPIKDDSYNYNNNVPEFGLAFMNAVNEMIQK